MILTSVDRKEVHVDQGVCIKIESGTVTQIEPQADTKPCRGWCWSVSPEVADVFDVTHQGLWRPPRKKGESFQP